MPAGKVSGASSTGPGAEAERVSIFMNRSKRAGRFLEWRIAVFAVGASLALGGIYLDQRWLVGVAIVVLAGGMATRFLPGGEEPEVGGPYDEDDAPEV